MNELQDHNGSLFITLTYNDKNLPKNKSLCPQHLTNFFKRLRKSYSKPLRHYSCGEYGDSTARPHYHAIIFGLELKDLEYYTHNNGNNLYNSSYMDKTWSHGTVIIGNVTFESCAYVARYILKKVTGKDSWQSYAQLDKETGEITNEREKEFTRMSNRPGIGSKWYSQYKSDIWNNDGTLYIRGGIPTKPPRFYEDKYELENPKHLQIIKQRRAEKAILNLPDNTKPRLKAKEINLLASTRTLTRTLE